MSLVTFMIDSTRDLARDSVTNRFHGDPLLGPNSMKEWLGWARAMNGALYIEIQR